MAEEKPPPGGLAQDERMGAMVKHVLQKALKYAVYGALIGGVLFALPTMLTVGPLAGAASGITGIFSGKAAAWILKGAVSRILSVGLTGAAWGGGILAAIGGIMGLTGASEAADEADAQSQENHARAEDRQLKVAALAMHRQRLQQAMAGPDQGLGAAPSLGMQLGGSDRFR